MGKFRFWKRLGPGLITGASDDDPSGIATYSQAGAQFGLGLLWTAIFTYPLMSAIQEISARLGRVTGHGIAGNLRRHYSKHLLYTSVFLLVVANSLNIGADIGAMAEALTLLFPGSHLFYVLCFGIASIYLEISMPYTTYVKYLKWLTLSLFTYALVLFSIHIPVKETLLWTFLPKPSFHSDYFRVILAVFGTTLSPYLFFWQASEEVEEIEISVWKQPLQTTPDDGPKELERIRIDTLIGMAVSNLIAYFIILTAALTLNKNNITDIDTAATAAKALEPIAGRFCFLFFALGIIGTGLLAIPVLAGSAAYAVGEALQWPIGLERKPLQAKGFYAVIAASILIGMGMNLVHISPMKALFFVAVINGIIAIPLMALILRMASNSKIMGKFVLSKNLKIIGWIATVVMGISAVGLFF